MKERVLDGGTIESYVKPKLLNIYLEETKKLANSNKSLRT